MLADQRRHKLTVTLAVTGNFDSEAYLDSNYCKLFVIELESAQVSFPELVDWRSKKSIHLFIFV